MKLCVLYSTFLFVLFLTAPAIAASGELDGKTFSGNIWSEGEKPDPDSFVFQSGMFRSTACDQYGYESAPYSVLENEGVKSFTSTTKNKNGATMVWQGTIQGSEIEGSAVMTTQAGEKMSMKFVGTRK